MQDDGGKVRKALEYDLKADAWGLISSDIRFGVSSA